MSLNEAVSEGLMVTGVGLLIVFSVLIILMLSLMAMKAVFYKAPENAAKKEVEKPQAKPVVQAEQKNENVQNDDTELVAVITAAIAATLNTSASNFNIKSFRRIGSNAPAWNKSGVAEMINSRL